MPSNPYLIQGPCFILQISFMTSRRHYAERVSGRLMGYVNTVGEPTGSDKLYSSDEIRILYSHCVAKITMALCVIRITGSTEATCVYSCTTV